MDAVSIHVQPGQNSETHPQTFQVDGKSEDFGRNFT